MKRIEREYGLGGFALSVYFSIGKRDCLKEFPTTFLDIILVNYLFPFFPK